MHGRLAPAHGLGQRWSMQPCSVMLQKQESDMHPCTSPTTMSPLRAMCMAGHTRLSRAGSRAGFSMHTAQPCRGTPLWAPRLMYQGSGSSILYWSCTVVAHMSLCSYEAYCCCFGWQTRVESTHHQWEVWDQAKSLKSTDQRKAGQHRLKGLHPSDFYREQQEQRITCSICEWRC